MESVETSLREFHRAYGLVINEEPVDFDYSTHERLAPLWMLRKNLCEEEWQEFIYALRSDSLVNLADAICDLVYVLVGTAVSFGIPFDHCFTEVHRSNMSKLGADGKPVVRESDGKILKGENYSPPNLKRVIYGE